jgi:hypothetical protein
MRIGAGLGARQRQVAAALVESVEDALGDFPTVRGDLNYFSVSVSDVKDDHGATGEMSGASDPSVDGLSRGAAYCLGGEGAEGSTERAVARGNLVLTVEAGDEPVAEPRRGDGDDLMAVGTEREADKEVALGGSEGSGRGGAFEEEFRLGSGSWFGGVWLRMVIGGHTRQPIYSTESANLSFRHDISC